MDAAENEPVEAMALAHKVFNGHPACGLSCFDCICVICKIPFSLCTFWESHRHVSDNSRSAIEIRHWMTSCYDNYRMRPRVTSRSVDIPAWAAMAFKIYERVVPSDVDTTVADNKFWLDQIGREHWQVVASMQDFPEPALRGLPALNRRHFDLIDLGAPYISMDAIFLTHPFWNTDSGSETDSRMFTLSLNVDVDHVPGTLNYPIVLFNMSLCLPMAPDRDVLINDEGVLTVLSYLYNSKRVTVLDHHLIRQPNIPFNYHHHVIPTWTNHISGDGASYFSACEARPMVHDSENTVLVLGQGRSNLIAVRFNTWLQSCDLVGSFSGSTEALSLDIPMVNRAKRSGGVVIGTDGTINKLRQFIAVTAAEKQIPTLVISTNVSVVHYYKSMCLRSDHLTVITASKLRASFEYYSCVPHQRIVFDGMPDTLHNADQLYNRPSVKVVWVVRAKTTRAPDLRSLQESYKTFGHPAMSRPELFEQGHRWFQAVGTIPVYLNHFLSHNLLIE